MKPQWTQPNSLRERLAASARSSMPARYPDLGLICLGLFVMLLGVGAASMAGPAAGRADDLSA